MDILASGASSDASSREIIRHKTHLYLISGMLLDLNPEVKLRPGLLIKEDFKGPTSLDLNLMAIFKDKFWIGASYRTGVKLFKKDFDQGQGVNGENSVAGVAQFFITDAFRIGYSYDYATSSLKTIENGSHEITLGLTFAQTPLKLLTPRFF